MRNLEKFSKALEMVRFRFGIEGSVHPAKRPLTRSCRAFLGNGRNSISVSFVMVYLMTISASWVAISLKDEGLSTCFKVGILIGFNADTLHFPSVRSYYGCPRRGHLSLGLCISS